GLFRGHEGGVYALAFSPDGKTLASASGDATVLIWDVAGTLQARRPASELALAKQLHPLWTRMAAENGPQTPKAVWELTQTPEATVRFLKKQLQPVAPVDAKRIGQWIADLGNERYRIRQQATDVLQELDQALSALHQTLETHPPLEICRRVEHIL